MHVSKIMRPNDAKCLNEKTARTNLLSCSVLVFKCTAELNLFYAVSIDILVMEGEPEAVHCRPASLVAKSQM